MEKLKELITYFVYHYPRPLRRTELVKMIFGFEYYHRLSYGEQYSGVYFIRDEFGPNDGRIAYAGDSLTDIISCTPYPNHYGTTSYEYNVVDGVLAQQIISSIPEKTTVVASFIVEHLRDVTPYHGFINFAYALPPMEEMLCEEERLGAGKLLRREINMANSRGIFKPTEAQREAARERRRKIQTKGSPEEYYANLAKEFRNYEDVRRRASVCLNN